MDESQTFDVIEAIAHHGQPLVLTLKAYDWFDTYSVYEPRSAPLCMLCGCSMEFVAYDSAKLFPELWRCNYCRHRGSFAPGDYGEAEIEISAKEWEQRAMVRSQRDLLHRRYGKHVPHNIRDYWLPKGEQDNG